MDFSNLSDEFKAKAAECKSQEDLINLIKEEGLELSDEQLNGIAGGGLWKECTSYEPCSAYSAGYR